MHAGTAPHQDSGRERAEGTFKVDLPATFPLEGSPKSPEPFQQMSSGVGGKNNISRKLVSSSSYFGRGVRAAQPRLLTDCYQER
jgi:hypothetical protein